jgi:hypothetical protein
MAYLPAEDAGGKKGYAGSGVLQVGATSGPTSVSRAEVHTEALVVEILRCAKVGNGTRLFTIVRDYPDIVMEPRVSDTLLSWMKKSRYRRGRGRPSAVYTFHPLLIYGLVNRLLATNVVENKEQAFTWLQEHEGPERFTARRLYYEACTDPRFRGLLLKYPESSRVAGDNEIEKRRPNAEVLRPGQEIVRTLTGPGLPPMEARFQGLDEYRI